MSLRLINKNKNTLLSVAMLWMAVRHMYMPIEIKLYKFIFTSSGYGSVDMILFILAFNVYFEIKNKNPYLFIFKDKILQILKFAIPYFVLLLILGKESIKDTIFLSLGISIFTKLGLSYWLVSFSIIMFIATPVYLKLFNKKPLLVTIVMSLIMTGICLTFTDYELFYIFFRVVIYFIGILFAYICEKTEFKNNKVLNTVVLFLMIVGWMLLFYLNHYVRNDIMHVYPFVLIVPGLCLLLSWIIEKTKVVKSILNAFSKYLIVFYLIHENVLNLLYENYGLLFIPNIGFDWWINIAGFVISVVLSIVTTLIINSLSKAFTSEKICR